MCDKDSLADFDRALRKRGLSRRQFAAATSAAMLAGCVKAGEQDSTGVGAAEGTGLTEQMVTIQTPDGSADAFLVHPATEAHPGVIMWPDVAGLRPAMKQMARNLAEAGYAVLCVNPYYRNAKPPVMETIAEYFAPGGQAKIKPMREALTPEAVMRDATAYVAFLDSQSAVNPERGIGTNGYCMGGPFTVRTAAAVPSRVKAAASFHGGSLVTDEPDSPHKLLGATQASYLFAIAQNDDAKAPGDKEKLKAAAEAANRPAEIEVYPADHGWCAIDAPVYDEAQADKAFARMTALFAGL